MDTGLQTDSTKQQSLAEGALSPISITLTSDWVESDLARTWSSLYSKSTPNVFLSWSWVRSWLAVIDERPLLVKAEVDKKTVGLGLLVLRTRSCLLGRSLKQLWLHRVGTEKGDQIWIEHNDFLLDQEYSDTVRMAIISYLLDGSSGYDELFLGLCNSEVMQYIGNNIQSSRIDITSTTYELDLSGIDSLSAYLAVLSRNSRSQINRTRKLLEKKYGPLKLEKANSTAAKESFLKEAAVLHRARWAETEYGSGFDNSVFTAFHQQLLLDDESNKITAIYSLQAGNQRLGFIYLLIDGTSWKFYLSALRLEDDNRIKVGLLFHSLVIEQAIVSNTNCYDFLAGDGRYKNSLSNHVSQQYMLCLYRSTPLLVVREKLRKIKRFYTKKKAVYTYR